MIHTKEHPMSGDKLTLFLQQTLGALAEGYVVSLAELSSIKDSLYQKELLRLKQDLKAKAKDKAQYESLEEQLLKKENELAALRKKLEKAEADLVLANTKNIKKQNTINQSLEVEKQEENNPFLDLADLFKPYF